MRKGRTACKNKRQSKVHEENEEDNFDYNASKLSLLSDALKKIIFKEKH